VFIGNEKERQNFKTRPINPGSLRSGEVKQPKTLWNGKNWF
jgi:hypothetical protein